MPRGNQPEPQPQRPGKPNDQEAAGGPLASIHVEELTPETAQQLDLPANVRGGVVNGIDPDSGVAELRKGDVIEEVNQQPVTSVADYKSFFVSLNTNNPHFLSVCSGQRHSFLLLRT